MDKLEYIQGDLVIYTSLIKEPIAEICEVHETSYTIKFMHGNSVRVESNEIKPIPLTPEILNKNEWKYDGAIWILKKGNIYIFILLDDKTYAAYLLGVRVLEFHFVHQLQHFLFGLGINHEMYDNCDITCYESNGNYGI